MVFVADTIPRELARIVEFLNEQMKADVRAVELSWFESESGVTALTPRIIGETERAQNEKTARSALPPIGREAWIQEHLAKFGAATTEGAEAFIEVVEQAGSRAEVSKAQASLIAVADLPDGHLYPMSLSPQRKGLVSLNLSNLVSKPAFASEEARQALYDRLVAVVGPLTTRTLNGYPGFQVTKLNDAQMREGLRDFLVHVRETAESVR